MSVAAIIPCYRHVDVLARALASVRAQTEPPAEALVVDDGNDDPAPIAKVAAEHGARVVRLEKNAGLASARNAGWNEATAKYVAFLDADDVWHPRKLEVQTRVMEAHPDVQMTATDLLIAAQPSFAEPPADLPLRRYSRTRTLLFNPSSPITWMLRRDAPIRFRPGRRHLEDHLFQLDAQDRGIHALHIGFPLSAVHKPLVSGKGLSSQLWKMEQAELSIYETLHGEGRLSAVSTRALQGVSLVKFVRRALLVGVWQRFSGR